MSNTTRLPYARMLPIAQSIVSRLAANCVRIEIAGSLRRKKDTIGDLEIVAVPTEALYAQLDELLATGKIRHKERKAWGQKQRAFVFETKSGESITVDLYLQPDPATFGYNFVVRTGSAEFSHKLVTKRSEGGWKPDCFEIEGARVKCNGMLLNTDEEIDIFNLWGMDYVQPELRTDTYKPPRLDSAQYEQVKQDLRAKGLGIEGQPTLRFTMEDARRLTVESATWSLPTFPGGTGQAARDAIEASERERRRVQGGTRG